MVDSLPLRPYVNAMSLVKDIMFDIIKEVYRDDVFFLISFKFFSKKSRRQEEIDNFPPIF